MSKKSWNVIFSELKNNVKRQGGGGGWGLGGYWVWVGGIGRHLGYIGGGKYNFSPNYGESRINRTLS